MEDLGLSHSYRQKKLKNKPPFSYSLRQLPSSLKKGHSSFLSTCVFLSKRLPIKLKFLFFLFETYNLFPFLFPLPLYPSLNIKAQPPPFTSLSFLLFFDSPLASRKIKPPSLSVDQPPFSFIREMVWEQQVRPLAAWERVGNVMEAL